MKKYMLPVSVLLVLFLAFSACGSRTSVPPPTSPDVNLVNDNPVGGFYPSSATIEFLEECSEMVVKGKFSDDTEHFYYDFDFGDNLPHRRVWLSKTTFIVTEVVEGDVKVGDNIPVIEPYSYEKLSDGKYNLHYSQMYLPSISHDEYLMFLEKSRANEEWDIGSYLPSLASFGRYPVIDETSQIRTLRSMPESELDIINSPGAIGTVDDYRDIYAEVYDKYLS